MIELFLFSTRDRLELGKYELIDNKKRQKQAFARLHDYRYREHQNMLVLATGALRTDCTVDPSDIDRTA